MRKLVFLLLMLLILPAVGSAKKFNFTVQNNTALNFENGSYIVEVIELSRPVYVKVNITSDGSSKINYLYDDEPIKFNEIELTSSSITGTSAVIMIEFPDGWGSPKQYQIVRPVLTPNIVLTLSVDRTNINEGDVVSFTINIKNTGNATAYNLTLDDPLPKGFASAFGRFPPLISDKLDAGNSQELYYALKAVEPGTFNIDPAVVKYGSKISTSNSLTITVAAAALEKSNLTTVISLDKNNVNVGDRIKATVTINNTGNASTKFVNIEFTPPQGMEVVEDNLEKVPSAIAPNESLSYRITLKANEAGNYTLHLKTAYNDASTGVPSDSEPIVVTQKNQNYFYILVPIVFIIAGIVLFTIKRHKEYSY